jgi:hypothetical protein
MTSRAFSQIHEFDGYKRTRSVVSGTVEPVICNTHARPDVAELYRSLVAAPPNSEDFEILSAAFKRACDSDPKGVLRALEQEALV